MGAFDHRGGHLSADRRSAARCDLGLDRADNGFIDSYRNPCSHTTSISMRRIVCVRVRSATCYLTEPAITPWTKNRWKLKNTISGTIRLMNDPDDSRSMLEPNCRVCEAR